MAARSPLGPRPRYIRYHPLYYSLGLHSSFIIHGFTAHHIDYQYCTILTKLWSPLASIYEISNFQNTVNSLPI